tara:strand:+ start:541 stop:726 length:186 start_codon:yes stop_codon:yes gene_type:complete
MKDENTVLFLLGYLKEPEICIKEMVNYSEYCKDTLVEIVTIWHNRWGGFSDEFLEFMGVAK